MSKIAVVYWSGTGNTAAMASAVAEGAQGKGAEVTIMTSGDFDASMIDQYDAIAFGCPAMGAEVLEESEFDPMFETCLPALNGKNIGLFGSYGWGDGEWMRSWEESCSQAGAKLPGGTVICHETPDDEALAECSALGAALA